MRLMRSFLSEKGHWLVWDDFVRGLAGIVASWRLEMERNCMIVKPKWESGALSLLSFQNCVEIVEIRHGILVCVSKP